MIKRVLVLVDGDAVAESLELIEVADRLYGREGREAWALVSGAAEAECLGAFEVVVGVAAPGLAPWDSSGLADCAEALHREHRFDAVLAPSTWAGRQLAPRVAMRLGAGLVAEVTEIRRGQGGPVLVRPAFSGRMLAEVACRGDGPLMMSVGRNAFARSGAPKVESRRLVVEAKQRRPPRLRLLGREANPGTDDIRESGVLVSGGGGAQRAFGRLEELARELGGMVSASRRLVDSGVAPRRVQVGQSGKSVSPRLYLALGISGSIQHVVGLKSAEHVIAVNTNRWAPICSLSDLVVEGDAADFVEKLLDRIRRGKSARAGAAGRSPSYGLPGGTE